MRYPRFTRSQQGVVIDILPRVWIVWTARTDDEASDYDDYGPVFYSYRVVRLVAWRLTLTWEWTR